MFPIQSKANYHLNNNFMKSTPIPVLFVRCVLRLQGCKKEANNLSNNLEFSLSEAQDWFTSQYTAEIQSASEIEKWKQPVISTDELISVTNVSVQDTLQRKNYRWKFARGTFNPSLNFYSIELGEHAFRNGEWVWKSLSHNNVTKEGLVVGGDINCTVNSSTATIGKFNAIMTIRYTIESKLKCGGVEYSTTTPGQASAVFDINY